MGGYTLASVFGQRFLGHRIALSANTVDIFVSDCDRVLALQAHGRHCALPVPFMVADPRNDILWHACYARIKSAPIALLNLCGVERRCKTMMPPADMLHR